MKTYKVEVIFEGFKPIRYTIKGTLNSDANGRYIITDENHKSYYFPISNTIIEVTD